MKNRIAISPKSLKVKIVSSLETIDNHSLQNNLGILLEASKREKMESSHETAATIVREYEFLGLVNKDRLKDVISFLRN